jgi:hypothetical protein
MQHHRILILLFAAALVSATILAFTSAARAEDAIVKLVNAENGKCLQSIDGSLNQGDAFSNPATAASLSNGQSKHTFARNLQHF